MSVLVTGGAGFIGSNLVRALVEEGYSVRVLDNFFSGFPENLEEVKSKVEIIKGDIRDSDSVRKAVQGMEYVFHEAAQVFVGLSIQKPEETNEINVSGTLNLLIASRDAGVKKVLFASSSSVYGNVPEKELPIQESRKPNPESPYALTKLIGEWYFEIFRKVYGMRYLGFRYFNVYGPRQNPESEYAAVVPKFIKRVLQGRPPVIYGDGYQSRDFVFIDDVVRANILGMEKNTTGVFNLGSGRDVTINELAEKICKLAGKELKPVYAKPRPGDVKYSLGDISLIKEKLGFRPEINLDEGLRKTIEWFKFKNKQIKVC